MNTKNLLLVLFLYHECMAQLPDASFSVSDTTGCAPFTVSFTNTSANANFFYWEFGDGTFSNLINPIHTYYGNGDFTVILWADDSTGNYDSAYFTVHVPDDAPFAVVPLQACPGEELQFFIAGNFYAANIISWNTGDGFTSGKPFFMHSYSATGLYTVTLSVFNPVCGLMNDTFLVPVSTSIVPAVHIHPEYGDTVICPGERFPFFYDEELPVHWDFGDGNSDNDPYPLHYYDSAGKYEVIVTVTNICGNTATIDTFLYVDPDAKPKATIYIKKNTLCPGEPLAFSTTGGTDYEYLWRFGDGDSATGKMVTHSFTDTGKYIVQMILTNICGNSTIKTVTVWVVDSLSTVFFMNISEKTACPGRIIKFITTKDIYSCSWNFGDGDTGNYYFAEHIYDSAGVYPVSLSVTNYCGNTFTRYDTIIIDTSLFPNASFSVSKNSACPGEMMVFMPADTGSFSNHLWDFGDGETDSGLVPVHIYSGIDSFMISHTVKNTCGLYNTAYLTVIIDSASAPLSSFYATEGNKICPGTEINFTNTSSDTATCLWIFGDGDSSVLVNPAHIYEQGGNYFVTLSVTNGCGMTGIVTKPLTVSRYFMLPPPVVTCFSSGDTISALWEQVPGATGYEVSIDGGSTWQEPNGSGLSHHITTAEDSITFQIRATGNSSCPQGVASLPTTCFIISIKENREIPGYSVFPIPVTDLLYISGTGYESSVYVRLFNAYGQLVLFREYKDLKERISVDFTDFMEGFFILDIRQGERTGRYKIIY
ncbi:MAG: PKD domain-containing protein [Bacteroidetes bacterium]|nr:PKD domain-containing protein [Bacteroidota bacterium]